MNDILYFPLPSPLLLSHSGPEQYQVLCIPDGHEAEALSEGFKMYVKRSTHTGLPFSLYCSLSASHWLFTNFTYRAGPAVRLWSVFFIKAQWFLCSLIKPNNWCDCTSSGEVIKKSAWGINHCSDTLCGWRFICHCPDRSFLSLQFSSFLQPLHCVHNININVSM